MPPHVTVVAGTLLGLARCHCGHVGDVSVREDMVGKGEPVQHAGVIGHGPCLVEGCPCDRFTWASRLPSDTRKAL